ncbi:flagellar assembly protein T N-terminal domain-containing protein [Myxococcota bacterium]|nr:flagellar assembly protein T N-terminal domain-containing protein [Myxococcota bacterium]
MIAKDATNVKCSKILSFGTGALLALLALAPGAASAGETETIEVEGVAAVVGNDIGRARDKAIDDAKRKAVEQVAGTQVSSESLTQNFQLVEDKVYSRASGFVKQFTIASEFKDQDGTYRVKIKATVDKSAVADNLAQLFKEKPRVIVMIAEQNVGGKGFSYWWGNTGLASEMDVMQTALIEKWQPKGFKFVDPGMLKGKLRVTKAMSNPALADQDVLTLSKGADADVAIVGKVLVTDAGQVMEGVKMHSFHAVGTLRILNVDTGEIIAVADETGVAPHIDANMGGRLAIKALASKIGDDLEKKILAKWTAEAASATELEVVVEGVKGSKQLDLIQKVIQAEVRGVEQISLRRREKGKAFFTVRVRQDANAFAREVEEKTYEGLTVEAADVTKARVTLEVTAK